MRNTLLGLLAAMLLAPTFTNGQSKVDFGRDVQPIFKAYCISCHGPAEQKNGFRLDRRSAALRGGTFPVIAPGNSEGSRLYLKLLGAQFGQQMPPDEHLIDKDIETIKRWLDEGAEWPDEFSGEGPLIAPDPAATSLMNVLRQGDLAAFHRELAANPAGARASGAAGQTPLMYAALYGNLETLQDLLRAGADVNAASDGGTTALMLAVSDVGKTRMLLEAGAYPNASPDDGRSALMIAAAQYGTAPTVKLLLDHGASPTTLSANRTTALRLAAGTGDAELMRLLIARGADVKGDAAAALTTTQLSDCHACTSLLLEHVDQRGLDASLTTMARWGNVAAAIALLDSRADINARDGAGRTPLMLASHTDNYSLDMVKLLLARGADSKAESKAGETAASLSAYRGGPIAELLAGTAATAVRSERKGEGGAVAQPRRSARAAVTTSLALLQKSSASFLSKSGCVSCHHNSLTSMTVELAKSHRIPVDENTKAADVIRLKSYLESWRESAWRGVGIPGGQDTVSYILLGAGAEKYQPDAASDAMAIYLKARQSPDGHWRVAANRPPMESSEIEVTAVSMRSLQLFAPSALRNEYDAAISAAATWLTAAKAATTEDRAFQLLGLKWAGGDRASLRKIAQALLDEQRPDGGWSPLPMASMTSDPYATGQALVALREAGMLTTRASAYAHGMQFLLDTQLEDGSWHTPTRALPVQAYFESGFPHGQDQWISAAATNWATMALIPAAK